VKSVPDRTMILPESSSQERAGIDPELTITPNGTGIVADQPLAR
jgi:hypothetical protein